MSNKTLILIFVALLGAYLLTRLLGGNRESTFNPEVVKVDTTLITEIQLTPKAEQGATIILKSTPSGWTATKDNQTINAPDAKVQGLLSQLGEIKSERIVSKSKDKWAEYEVDDKGSRVQVFNNKKVLADFVVGAFKFDQAKRSATAYIRRSDDEAVYIVDGFMSMSFNQGFNAFRNSEMIKLTAADVREVAVIKAGERVAIAKDPEDGFWYRGGMEKLDSSKAAQFIAQLTNIHGSDYVEKPSTGTPIKSIEITVDNLTSPVRVDCFMQADTAKPFVFNSTLNPETWFASDSGGVFQRIFVKFDELLFVPVQ